MTVSGDCLIVDDRLSKLISDYQRCVAEAVSMLADAGIPRPISDTAWVVHQMPYRGDLSGGFKYYKHGCGCSVKGRKWSVDFDFGERGQIDAFNVHRLVEFAGDQLKDYGFSSEEELRATVEKARRHGEIVGSGPMLYVGAGAG